MVLNVAILFWNLNTSEIAFKKFDNIANGKLLQANGRTRRDSPIGGAVLYWPFPLRIIASGPDLWQSLNSLHE
jgi:hypothetical protein